MSALIDDRNHWLWAGVIVILVMVMFGLFLRFRLTELTSSPATSQEATQSGVWDNSNKTLASMAAALGLPQVTSDEQAAAMARGGHQTRNLTAEIETHPDQVAPTVGSTWRADTMYEYGQEKDLASLAAAGATIDADFIDDTHARLNLLGRTFTGTYDNYHITIDAIDGNDLGDERLQFTYIREGDELIAGSHWVEIHFHQRDPASI